MLRTVLTLGDITLQGMTLKGQLFEGGVHSIRLLRAVLSTKILMGATEAEDGTTFYPSLSLPSVLLMWPREGSMTPLGDQCGDQCGDRCDSFSSSLLFSPRLSLTVGSVGQKVHSVPAQNEKAGL